MKPAVEYNTSMETNLFPNVSEYYSLLPSSYCLLDQPQTFPEYMSASSGSSQETISLMQTNTGQFEMMHPKTVDALNTTSQEEDHLSDLDKINLHPLHPPVVAPQSVDSNLWFPQEMDLQPMDLPPKDPQTVDFYQLHPQQLNSPTMYPQVLDHPTVNTQTVDTRLPLSHVWDLIPLNIEKENPQKQFSVDLEAVDTKFVAPEAPQTNHADCQVMGIMRMDSLPLPTFSTPSLSSKNAIRCRKYRKEKRKQDKIIEDKKWKLGNENRKLTETVKDMENIVTRARSFLMDIVTGKKTEKIEQEEIMKNLKRICKRRDDSSWRKIQ